MFVWNSNAGGNSSIHLIYGGTRWHTLAHPTRLRRLCISLDLMLYFSLYLYEGEYQVKHSALVLKPTTPPISGVVKSGTSRDSRYNHASQGIVKGRMQYVLFTGQ